MRVGGRRGRLNLGVGGARLAIGDVGPDGGREQRRLLAHNAQLHTTSCSLTLQRMLFHAIENVPNCLMVFLHPVRRAERVASAHLLPVPIELQLADVTPVNEDLHGQNFFSFGCGRIYRCLSMMSCSHAGDCV